MELWIAFRNFTGKSNVDQLMPFGIELVCGGLMFILRGRASVYKEHLEIPGIDWLVQDQFRALTEIPTVATFVQ